MDDEYYSTINPQVKLIVPESSVNYDKKTEDAVEWTLNDSSYFIRMNNFLSFRQNIFVSQSSIYFEDKWSLNEIRAEERERSFYELEASNFWAESGSSTLFSTIYFRASLKKRLYSLDPYKVMALLGDIGGFTELLALFGFALTTRLVHYQFARDVMSSTYHVQHYNDN